MKLSNRDKFLMREAFNVGRSQFYESSSQWLSGHIDDVGHTVEEHIAFDASKIVEPLAMGTSTAGG